MVAVPIVAFPDVGVDDSAKYVVVVVIEGVTKDVPEAKEVPPEAFAYQLIVAPEFGVAPKVTVPVPHLVAGVVPVTLFVNVI
ncbi:hypothetical protein FLTE109939_04865 [Flavobacterium terrigena]